MAEINKLRVTQDYSKLSEAIKEQVKLVYPEGYSQFLIKFTNKEGKPMKRYILSGCLFCKQNNW
jgi:hypothetical protein